MAARLTAVGYVDAASWMDPATDIYTLQVGDDNVSKNQLAFDVKPMGGSLAASVSSVAVPPGTWEIVQISGPVGAVVNVKFKGVGFVPLVEFVIPPSGVYNFQFGPCPSGWCVVEPQRYEFIVEGTLISPVSVLATFR